MPIVDLDPQPLDSALTTPEKAFVTPGAGDLDMPERTVTPMTLGERALGAAAGVVPGGSLFYNVVRGPAFAPAMRKDNLLASIWSSESAWTDRTPDPDFNPFDHIKGTKYEQFPESFIGVRNQRQFTATQRDIDREEEDNKTLAALPWYQTLPASLLANVIDPTVVLPGGGFYRGAKGGFSFLRTAASVGAGAGAQSAVQEAGLQAIQETRTGAESALNIGSSVLLGSLLGWGGAAVLSRGEMRSAIAAVDRQLGTMGDDAAAIIEDLQPKLVAAGRSADEAAVEARIVAARYGARAERLGASSALDLYQGKVEVRAGEFDPAAMALPEAERQFFQSAPTFYSAVLRSVETAKQEKAPAAQWLGTLKNTPGVKPEEMEWLGLENWLKEQKGPVTRQAIADYVRANQIEVREVEKGLVQPGTRYSDENVVPIAPGTDPVARDGGRFWYFRTPDNVFQILKAQYPTEDAAKAYIIATKQPTAIRTTKFDQWQLPGGENYRELLLTLPVKEAASGETMQDFARRLAREAGDDWESLGPNGRQRYTDEAKRLEQQTSDVYRVPSAHAYGRADSDRNRLAHIRFNDRMIDGKRTLFLEEIQSDWHQQGRQRGYRTEEGKVSPKTYTKDDFEILRNSNGNYEVKLKDDPEGITNGLPWAHSKDWGIDMTFDEFMADVTRELTEKSAARASRINAGLQDVNAGKVPDAPFKTTWPELSLKRMIRYAAENGYEQIAWTTGKTQAERYDLSKHVKEIEYINRGGRYELGITDKNGNGVALPQATYAADELPDVVGKEVADKIIAGEGRKFRGHEGYTLENLDLKIGGEGMSGFYDKMLPAAANKLVKKYGGKVERGEVATSTRDGEGLQNQFNDLIEEAGGTPTMPSRATTEPVHVLPLTDKMKEAALGEGFPLFQAGGAGPRGRITFTDNKAIIDLFSKADQSTFMHEAGHLWLKELIDDAALPNAPQQIKDDLGKVLKWLNVEKADAIGRAQQEQWAKGFERYLAEGKAPSSALAEAFEKFKQWLTAIYKSLTELGAPLSDDVRGVMDRLLATDEEIANALAGNVQFPHSVGAAAVTEAPIGVMAISGRVAAGVARGTSRLNPGLRTMHSSASATRRLIADLAEMSTYLKGNEDGMASPRAVETLRKAWDGGLIQAEQATRKAYVDYRKRTGGYALTDRLGDLFGPQRTSFYDEVGKALRRGDESEIPEVAAAAKIWRAKVFDPLKNAAIEVGLLPADVKTETAISYFSRIWNTRRLNAEEFVTVDGQPGFKPTVENWIKQNFPAWKAGFERSAQRRMDPLQREIDDLEMAKLRRASEAQQREGGEVDPGGISEESIRSAIQVVRGGAPRPKGVETLTQFVRNQGGLLEDGGELAHIGINNRSMPGFIRKEKRKIGPDNKVHGGGWDIDSMARHAWENGFFPEHSERPSRNEFLEALSDDFNKRRAVVRPDDRDLYRQVELVDRIEQDLARLGIEPTEGARFSTSDELKGMVNRVREALDIQDDRRIASLKKEMTERQSKIDEEREVQFKGSVDEMARDIANEVFAKLTGRTGEGVRPGFIKVTSRGPLKERTFHIPDELVERWLESDVSVVGRNYTRIMGADVELARKFGSPDMEEALAKVGEEYARLREQHKDSAKKLSELAKEEAADLRDLRAVRDIIRNVPTQAWQDYGHIARKATALQYILKMGQVVLSSLTEPVRVLVAKASMPFMQDSFAALGNIGALKLSIKEAQLAGNISDNVLGSRMAGLYDIMDFYGSRGPVEKFLDNMTNVASHWNGIRLWTDFVKSIAATHIQNQILDYTGRFTSLGAKERRYMHMVGIDEGMADRIAKEFAAHGQDINGVRVAGTEQWTDEAAKRAYRAALNKDLDSMVVTRGAADTPLFANTPLGKVLFQFNTFNLASHQRVLLRGLQEGHARFLSGVVALSSMGMLQTYLTALATNSVDKLPDPQKNPGWWISEGLDRSGFFSVPMMLANAAEKLTGINPIKAPIKAGDEGQQGSQKNRNRDKSSILGPTMGTIGDVATTLSMVESAVKGEDIKKSQKNAAERIMPYNSFVGVRQILKYFVNPPEN